MEAESGYWRRLAERRLTRRRMLGAAGVGSACLAAVTLTGCSSGTSKSSAPSAKSAATGATAPAGAAASPAAKQPKRGGKLVHLTGDTPGTFPVGLDPHIATGAYTGAMSLFYQGLIRLNPNPLQVDPEIAQKWEQPTPTEYLFHLAPGIKWQNKPPLNGRLLTANDVVFSLNRARTNDPKFLNKGLFEGIDKIEAVDPVTVHVTTVQPNVTTLTNLGDITLLILAPEVVQKYDKLTNADQAIGTGAFILQAKDDTGATTVRNPDYWKPGLPYLDTVGLVDIKDDGTRWAAFTTGQLDVLSVPGQQVKTAEAENGKKYTVGVAKATILNMIWINAQKKPFSDPRVSRALRLLVDHQEAVTGFLDVWFGAGNALTLPQILDVWDLSPNEYATMLEWKQPKDDAVKEAIALLSAAGFTKDKPLQLDQGSSADADYIKAEGQLLQDQWRRLSQGVVQPRLLILDTPSARQRENSGDFDVLGPYGRSGHFDPDQTFEQIYHSKGGNNFGKFSDPTLDQMIEKQRVTFDAQQRKAAVQDVVRYLIDHAPYTSFASHGRLNAWQSKVQNITAETGRPHMWQYEHVWLDT